MFSILQGIFIRLFKKTTYGKIVIIIHADAVSVPFAWWVIRLPGTETAHKTLKIQCESPQPLAKADVSVIKKALMHRHAAVVHNELAGDIVTHIAGQKHGCSYEILGDRRSFYALIGLLDLLKRGNIDSLALIELLTPERVREARGNGIHVYFIVAQLPRHTPREGHNGAL